MIKKINSILSFFNIVVTRRRKLEKLEKFHTDIDEILKTDGLDIVKLNEIRKISKSQNYQDIFCLLENRFKRNGFFVEFGATNGFDISNTYILEKNYDWKGILVEPAKNWHLDLLKNRQCIIDTSCVYKESGAQMQFNEIKGFEELSTLDKYSVKDSFNKVRKQNSFKYMVRTISLEDLLDKYNAPKEIDFLSIDTEGSEYEILSNFNFSKYTFKVITCEHNYTSNQEKIHKLLTNNGYKRKYFGLSRADDWYVKI